MSDSATVADIVPSGQSLLDRKIKKKHPLLNGVIIGLFLAGCLGYIGIHVAEDMNGVPFGSPWPYLLLGIALLCALGFELVNGFHDTANAVATVIYTHSLSPTVAVVLSGLCNLAGVLASSGAVAFSVITLLPVDLILQVRSNAGFAMVFALLIAAIVWNLGTWYLGLPSSSSHTMIGSIIGVGVANQIMSFSGKAAGVDWEQAFKVLRALIISPLIGFTCAALLFLVSKRLVKYQKLYDSPKNDEPPPWPIRALLVLTCSGVSFTHGSNDGQKGMGLIMLILIGTVPAAYALNHAVTAGDLHDFLTSGTQAAAVLNYNHEQPLAAGVDERSEVENYVRTRHLHPQTISALSHLIVLLGNEVEGYKEFKNIPVNQLSTVRSDMYYVSESLALIQKKHDMALSPSDSKTLYDYKAHIDHSIKYIPGWVKVVVALALGLGTMIGWKRTVVTVGEKIGKSHLTYAQGVCAQMTAMATIAAADIFGLPVSTTHVLSSGIAGTMAASRSGLQSTTIRNIAAAWVFTLPASAMLSGILFWIFRHIMP